MPRSSSVDALRGFALLGIGVVNLPHLAMPMAQAMAPPDGAANFAAKAVIGLLFEGKFFVLFAFLFGWGFGVQLALAAREGRRPASAHRARLIALALFGAAHAILVFHGDILLAYAILGSGLWRLRDASPRLLLRIAIATVPLSAITFGLLAVLDGSTEELARTGFDLSGQGYLGSFTDAVRQRIADWPVALMVIALFNGPLAFGALCLGLAAQKVGFFEPGSPFQAVLTRRAPLLLAIGLVANGAYAAASVGLLPAGWAKLCGFAALAVGAPALSAVYVAVVIRLGERLALLTPAGSMPLTGYIAQGLIAGAVFHGWGFGLFGALGPAALIAVSGGIWLIVTASAALWRRRWSRGPLDAALRVLLRMIEALETILRRQR